MPHGSFQKAILMIEPPKRLDLPCGEPVRTNSGTVPGCQLTTSRLASALLLSQAQAALCSGHAPRGPPRRPAAPGPGQVRPGLPGRPKPGHCPQWRRRPRDSARRERDAPRTCPARILNLHLGRLGQPTANASLAGGNLIRTRKPDSDTSLSRGGGARARDAANSTLVAGA